MNIWNYINDKVKSDENYEEDLPMFKIFMSDNVEKYYEERRVSKEEKSRIFTMNNYVLNLWRDIYIASLERKNFDILKMILCFGVINEELLSEEQILKLSDFSATVESKENVIFLLNWLRGIYLKKIIPSVSGDGLDFVQYLLEKDDENIKVSLSKKIKIYENSSGLDGVTYEFDILKEVVRKLTYYSSNYPILLTEKGLLKTGVLDQSFNSPQKIINMINEIRDIDFGLFYKQMMTIIAGKTYKVYLEIKPYFIVVPIVSDIFLYWQSSSFNDNKTRGRIYIPAYYSGNNLEKEVVFTLGLFRWHREKEVAGVHYMSPLEGGIAGKFYDFYENSQKILVEEEELEELKEIKAKHRGNIARVFSEYYVKWILFEAKGRLVLPKAIRSIFWEDVPFSKKYKSQLSKSTQHSEGIRISNHKRGELSKMNHMFFQKLTKTTSEESKMIESTRYYLSL